MTKIVQLVGHTRAGADAYLGASREITIDTEGHEIRVHDGVQVGGYRILPVDANNLLYQPKSPELTAIMQLGDNTPGFLSKQGDANYALRTIAGTANQINVANGNGQLGNPTLSLAAVIDSSHTFTGNIIFSAEVVGSAGFNGSLTGNVTGDTAGTHAGNVVGNVTGNLTGNAAGSHTGTFTGNVNVSGAVLTLDTGQIPQAAIANIANIVQVGNAYLVPAGAILIWSGTFLSIPAGWVPCDGTNDTPDLRDKFVLGAYDGGSPAQGSSGGSATHNHGTKTSTAAGGHTPSVTVQGHALTVNELPSHDHLSAVASQNTAANQFDSDATSEDWYMDNDTGGAQSHGRTEAVGGDQTHTHGATAAAVPNHDHDVTVDAASNVPPYYALFFIMKT